MEYEKILTKIKKLTKKSTITQRVILGFILLVILIGVVAYINPKKKFIEMRNSQRRSDVVNILNAVYQYGIENEGNLPQSISGVPSMICQSGASSCDGLIDLSQVIANKKKFLSKIPVDPKEKSANSSGYQISRFSNGRINVIAPLAENNAVISLSK